MSLSNSFQDGDKKNIMVIVKIPEANYGIDVRKGTEYIQCYF